MMIERGGHDLVVARNTLSTQRKHDLVSKQTGINTKKISNIKLPKYQILKFKFSFFQKSIFQLFKTVNLKFRISSSKLEFVSRDLK